MPEHARVVVGPSIIAHSLPSRPERLALTVPLAFVVDDLRTDGHTVNVSESGLLAIFDQPLDLWTNGEISFTVGEYYLQIKARVARTHDRDAGLSFLIETENDRLTVQILLDVASGRSQPEELNERAGKSIIAAMLESQR